MKFKDLKNGQKFIISGHPDEVLVRDFSRKDGLHLEEDPGQLFTPEVHDSIDVTPVDDIPLLNIIERDPRDVYAAIKNQQGVEKFKQGLVVLLKMIPPGQVKVDAEQFAEVSCQKLADEFTRVIKEMITKEEAQQLLEFMKTEGYRKTNSPEFNEALAKAGDKAFAESIRQVGWEIPPDLAAALGLDTPDA